MKIYLLLIDHARFFFYSDDLEGQPGTEEGSDSPVSTQSKAVGWLHERYERFRSAWQHADAGALLWMRRCWDWLHSWVHPDEAMLARIRIARRIDLHYPASRAGDSIRTIWNDYLCRQRRRHLYWLTLNGVIAPLAIVTLWILPGPNLIGYWFAYRAIHHALVVWGIRRVLRNKIPTELHPMSALDLPVSRDGDGKVGHFVLTGPSAWLDEHVAWHTSSAGLPVEHCRDPAPKQLESPSADSVTKKP